jgi:hypothetical protein
MELWSLFVKLYWKAKHRMNPGQICFWSASKLVKRSFHKQVEADDAAYRVSCSRGIQFLERDGIMTEASWRTILEALQMLEFQGCNIQLLENMHTSTHPEVMFGKESGVLLCPRGLHGLALRSGYRSQQYHRRPSVTSCQTALRPD